MKRKTQFLSALPAAVRLYRDDLDFIIAAIQEQCKEVRISDDEHEYESLDELASHHAKKVETLSIRGETGGHITLQIRRGVPGVMLDAIDTEKAFFTIRERLTAREKPIAKVSKAWKFIAPIPLAVGFFARSKWQLVAAIGGLATCFIAGAAYSSGWLSTVYLTKRAERTSFVDEHGSEIAIAVVTAIITAVITWALTKMLGP